MATNITKTWEYPLMDPDEVIVGMKGLIKAMPVLYGPNFEGMSFSSKCCNIRTGETMEKTMHHCTYNDAQGHAITKQCFLKGHQMYCCEWMKVDGHRVRCGVRIKVESGGCGTHRSKMMEHCNNLLIKNLIAGKRDSITWRELNDPVSMAQYDADAAQTYIVDETTQAILTQHQEQLEEIDTIGALPAEAYNVHITFNENRIQKERTDAEKRKAKAAERKSGIIGKLKGSTADIQDEVPALSQNPRLVEAEQKRRFGKSFFKSNKKSGRPDASKFMNKRGGKNASELSSQD